jgi:thioredoxin 1
MAHHFTSKDPSILSNGTVIVDFYADWCGPCKKYAPEFESLAKVYTKMTFVKVNADEFDDVMQKFDIQSLPTTLVLKNGKEEGRVEGFNLDEIKAMIETSSKE